MRSLGRYPRYKELRKMKTSAGGLDPAYLARVSAQLRDAWAAQREAIADALETGTMTELRHWLRALLEAVHDIETGMSAVETALPGISMLLEASRQEGRRRRDLYTALLVLSCWEQGYTGDDSEASLSTEAKLLGLGTRALLDLLRRAEGARALVAGEKGREGERRAGCPRPEASALVVAIVTARPPSRDPKRDLWAALRSFFSQGERVSLLRGLGVDPEDVKLSPETRDDFVWAMVGYLERERRLADLWAAIATKRPHALAGENPFR